MEHNLKEFLCALHETLLMRDQISLLDAFIGVYASILNGAPAGPALSEITAIQEKSEEKWKLAIEEKRLAQIAQVEHAEKREMNNVSET